VFSVRYTGRNTDRHHIPVLFLRSIALVLASAALLAIGAEVISFPNGSVVLHGVIYKPVGQGPFRAVLYNHGSALDNSAASDALGPLFASRGWGVLHATSARARTQLFGWAIYS
jgi:hypothetical protein